MSLSSVPEQSDDPGKEYYRTSRQIFRQTFGDFGEAFSAIPLFLLSPVLWLTGKRSLYVALAIVAALVAFKGWILMLIIGMLHNWRLAPVSLSYQRSFLLAAMLYLLVAGFDFEAKSED